MLSPPPMTVEASDAAIASHNARVPEAEASSSVDTGRAVDEDRPGGDAGTYSAETYHSDFDHA